MNFIEEAHKINGQHQGQWRRRLGISLSMGKFLTAKVRVDSREFCAAALEVDVYRFEQDIRANA